MFSKSVIAATLFATGLAASGTARAADPVGSAILGAGAGALLGHALGGRDGALIGGALGAVAGATAASAQRASRLLRLGGRLRQAGRMLRRPFVALAARAAYDRDDHAP